MINRKAIEWFKNRIAVMPESETKEMFCMAVAALEKQGQTIDKSCETCRHKNRSSQESPCCDCYLATAYEDCYEAEEES